MDYSALSKEELIAKLENSRRPDVSRLTPIAAPTQDGKNIYIGHPTSSDLEVINSMAATEQLATQWRVIPFLASDNFLNYNYRVWSANTLTQMGQKYAGSPLILNHDISDVASSVGFIFSSQLHTDDAVSDQILNAGVFGEMNKAIAAKQNYNWILLKTAVEVDSPFDRAAMSRRVQNCSTGFWLHDSKMYCPDCSEQHGRDVEFTEQTVSKDAKGREHKAYTCPHTPISLLNLAIWNWYKEDGEEEPNWSSYVIKDGLVDPIEHSAVVSGALPAAQIIR